VRIIKRFTLFRAALIAFRSLSNKLPRDGLDPP
jgi:hypothetical protein